MSKKKSCITARKEGELYVKGYRYLSYFYRDSPVNSLSCAMVTTVFERGHDFILNSPPSDYRTKMGLLQRLNYTQLCNGIMQHCSIRTMPKVINYLVEKGVISKEEKPDMGDGKTDNTTHYLFHPEVINEFLENVWNKMTDEQKGIDIPFMYDRKQEFSSEQDDNEDVAESEVKIPAHAGGILAPPPPPLPPINGTLFKLEESPKVEDAIPLVLQVATKDKSAKEIANINELYKSLKVNDKKHLPKLVEIVDVFKEVTGKSGTTYAAKEQIKLLLKHIDHHPVSDFANVFKFKNYKFRVSGDVAYISIPTMCRGEKFQTNLQLANEWLKDNQKLENKELSPNLQQSYDNLNAMIMKDYLVFHKRNIRMFSKSEFSDFFLNAERVYAIPKQSRESVIELLENFKLNPSWYTQYDSICGYMVGEVRASVAKKKSIEAKNMASKGITTTAYKRVVNPNV